jgi:hypothetical protein
MHAHTSTQSAHHSCHILTYLNFLFRNSKNTRTSNFMNIRPVVADMFHAGRHDEVIVSFRNFAQAPQQRDAAMSPSYAVTTPLKIMLFCKHLQATHPTHLSVGTLGTLVQPASRKTWGLSRSVSASVKSKQSDGL